MLKKLLIVAAMGVMGVAGTGCSYEEHDHHEHHRPKWDRYEHDHWRGHGGKDRYYREGRHRDRYHGRGWDGC